MTRMPNPGRGSGGLDLNAMMKQVQQMQAEMMQAQEKLKDEVVEASAGGGMVKVKVNGQMEVLKCTVIDEALKGNDRELLEDLIVAATNQALQKARQQAAEETAKVATGLGLPAGMNFPGLS